MTLYFQLLEYFVIYYTQLQLFFFKCPISNKYNPFNLFIN